MDDRQERVKQEEQAAERAVRGDKKRAKKQTQAQMIALEKQLVKEGKILPRGRYIPRSYLGRVLAVLLAFLFGIFVMLGALFGAGYYIGTKPVKNVFQMLGIDYTGLIEEAYADMPILDLINEVRNDLPALNDPSALSLNTFAKYTPIIRTQLESLQQQLAEMGVAVDLDELMATLVSELASYLRDDLLPSIELGGVIGVNAESHPLLLSVCYGIEGVDYTIDAEGAIVMNEGHEATTVGTLLDNDGMTSVINRIELGSVIELTPDDTLLLSIFYGKEGEGYRVVDGAVVPIRTETQSPVSVADLTDSEKVQSLIDDIELGTVLGLSPESDAMMLAICYGTEGEDYEIVDGKIEMLGDARPVTIGALTENSAAVINDIELGTVLGLTPESDAMMLAICYGTEGEDYEIVDGKIEMLGDARPVTIGALTENSAAVINDIQVASLLSVDADDNATMRYLAYGSEGTHYEIVQDAQGNNVIRMLPIDPADPQSALYTPRTIGDLTAEDADLVGDAKIGDLVKIDENATGILSAVSDWTISELNDSDKIKSLKIGDIVEIDKSAAGILSAVSGWTIGELNNSEKIKNELLVGDLVEVDENATGILSAISGWTIGELNDPDKIDTLVIGDIVTIGEGDSGILGAVSGWTIGELAQQKRIERLTIGNILAVDDNATGILGAIRNWRIGDLSDSAKIDSLTLGEVLTIDETSGLLSALADTPLGELNDAVDSLRLSDIIPEQDLQGNAILRNLGGSTVSTLAADLNALSVAQVFGDDMYLYLDPTVSGSYAEIVNGYDPSDPEKSAVRPRAIPADAKIDSRRVLTAAPATEVTFGYFLQEGATYRPVAAENVYRTLQDGTVVYTVRVDHTLEAIYGWRYVDFENGGAYTPLPAGHSVEEAQEGYVYRTQEGEFPVLEDASGYYYESGAGRVDLERVAEGFLFNGEPLDYDAKTNTVTFEGESLKLRSRAGEYYVTAEEAAIAAWYVDTGAAAYDAVYDEAQTKTTYTATWTDERGYHENAPVERYLSGVWYVLFGGEEADGTIIDNTDMPVLNIAPNVTNVASEIAGMSLWEMYLHAFISANPYQEIPESILAISGDVLNGKNNLNELNVNETISLVQRLIASSEELLP